MNENLISREKAEQRRMVQAAFKKMGFDKVPALMQYKNVASLK